MMIRAPRPSDLLWFAMFAFSVAAFRMFFAPDPPAACPEGTGCHEAFEQNFGNDNE
jgi:hypothetical protein